MLNATSANEFYTNHMTTFLCHVTTSFGHHVISFLQPTVQNSNGGFTTLVILIVHQGPQRFLGAFHSRLCQRFRKFRSEFKWKGSFRFLLTGIFGITSGGGPHFSVGIFRPKLAVPFLTNRFFALVRELGNKI